MLAKVFETLLYKIELYFLTFIGLCCFAEAGAQSEKVEKPNIIFLFVDDMGWGDLSCYGNDRIKTPALDKLASEGTLFTQFYVAASVCSPSRTAIMTGQYPARNSVFGHFATTKKNIERGMPDQLDPELTMLTDLLKREGYVTGHFGKWHLGSGNEISPEDYGIDFYRTEHYSNFRNKEAIDIWSPQARPNSTKEILEDTMEFIDGNKGEPFYANVWFSDVHATLNPSKEQLENIRGFKAKNIKHEGIERIYYASLLEMDRQIGLFVDKLDQMGLSSNTLIILSSDNGPEDYQISNSAHSGAGSSGPFRGRKRSIYEGGIRVPFIIRMPETVPAGKVNTTSVVNGVDFMPSIAKLASASIPESVKLDGEDMSDVWLGSNRERTQPLFWEWRYKVFGHVLNKPPRLAVRHGDWKLLMNPDSSRIELYNVFKDPSELHNMVDIEPKILGSLVEKLLLWNADLPKSPVSEIAGSNAYDWPGN